ncbi:probable glutathione S-transferase [Neltuma alba]|uniref:probable glutathione S-transferase n=1 Tax=Neltuma alba TaxID=207710 RepID=UPI0010A4CFA3|nr:probable glutathione S-transferase [Prosopis alba]XP_028805416.1 probable glutathione S-transferase [Prosopis alba]
MGEVKLIATPQSFPCARIEWALKMKGVEYEYIKENLLNKSDLLLQSNPVHKKVPVLLHNGLPIAESLVILEYIDETWKQNPLLPQDPHDRAHARFWARFIDEKCVAGVWGAGVAQGEGKEKAIESALELLALLDKQIEGKKYFGGEEIGYLDIVAGWIPHWLNVLEELGEMELLTAERFPHLHQWSLNLLQTSPVKDCLPPRDSVVDYFSFGFNYVRSMAANK